MPKMRAGSIPIQVRCMLLLQKTNELYKIFSGQQIMILETILMGGIMVGWVTAIGYGVIIAMGKMDDWEKKKIEKLGVNS